MVKGDILNSHNNTGADKRCLTLDFKQPKRICKMQDNHQQKQQLTSGNSPDWASSLALTTPELDDKVSQFANQLDLFAGLPTPTTTSMLLSPPGTSNNTYSRIGFSTQTDTNNEASGRINFSSASLTPTSDIERHLQQIQSLQTPLFEPIRDILTAGSNQQSAANSPTASQASNNNNNNNITTTLSNQYNLNHQNINDNQTTTHHTEESTTQHDNNNNNNNNKESNSTYNHTNNNNNNQSTTDANQRDLVNQRERHDCKTDALLPTPLFELDDIDKDIVGQRQLQHQNNTTRGRNDQQQQAFSQATAETALKQHSHDMIAHQDEQHQQQQMNNNSENDMLNINIPLSVRRISDQSCSSSMDSSYSPKFLPLTNSMVQVSNLNSRQQQQQQQPPYLLLTTDANVFSSDSPDQLNSMIDSQDKMKIERKRERNRLAASKCRKRKIERITQLEEQVAQLEERLKRANNELDRHKKSGCRLGSGGSENHMQ